MPEICELQGAEGHRVSVYLVEPSEQGYARCTCGWANQHVFYSHVHAAALRHARTTTGATPRLTASGCPPETAGIAAAPVVHPPTPTWRRGLVLGVCRSYRGGGLSYARGVKTFAPKGCLR